MCVLCNGCLKSTVLKKKTYFDRGPVNKKLWN